MISNYSSNMHGHGRLTWLSARKVSHHQKGPASVPHPLCIKCFFSLLCAPENAICFFFFFFFFSFGMEFGTGMFYDFFLAVVIMNSLREFETLSSHPCRNYSLARQPLGIERSATTTPLSSNDVLKASPILLLIIGGMLSIISSYRC